MVGRIEECMSLRRDVYSGYCRLSGEDGEASIASAHNYATSLNRLERFEEAKALFRKMTPVARRVLGEEHRLTLKMRWCYAEALYKDGSVPLDDLRESVTTLEDTERTARRVFGGTHPLTMGIENNLQNARAALRAREAPPPSGDTSK